MATPNDASDDTLYVVPSAVMTTTRIRQTEVFCNAPEQWEKLWAEGKYAVCGEAADEIKLRSMEKETRRYPDGFGGCRADRG